jgi:hypothetical protein
MDHRGRDHPDPAPHAGALPGRVDAALEFAITIPLAASIAVGAALIAVVHYRILLLAMAAVIASSAVYLASRRATQRPPARCCRQIACRGNQREHPRDWTRAKRSVSADG